MNRWWDEPPSIGAPLFTWARKSRSAIVGGCRSVIVCLDPGGDGTVDLGELVRAVPVKPTEDDDAGVVGLVAEVEDEVVVRVVVAEVAHVGVRAIGLVLDGQG